MVLPRLNLSDIVVLKEITLLRYNSHRLEFARCQRRKKEIGADIFLCKVYLLLNCIISIAFSRIFVLRDCMLTHKTIGCIVCYGK